MKLLIEIIEEFDADGEPKKFYGLPDAAKLTFILLLCLRANYNGKIPYPNDRWLKKRLGIRRLYLQPLVDTGFITIENDSVSNSYQSDTETLRQSKRERERTEKDIYVFDEARKIYPGTKRGNQTEFENFFKKHKDWKEVLPLLKPAIEKQITWRKNAKGSDFVPAWKNFKTWINNRCWEDEVKIPEPKSPENKHAAVPIPNCLVCHHHGYIEGKDQKGKQIALCISCLKGWKKIYAHQHFSGFTQTEIEKYVLAGKAKR